MPHVTTSNRAANWWPPHRPSSSPFLKDSYQHGTVRSRGFSAKEWFQCQGFSLLLRHNTRITKLWLLSQKESEVECSFCLAGGSSFPDTCTAPWPRKTFACLVFLPSTHHLVTATHYNSAWYTFYCVGCLVFPIKTQASWEEDWSLFCSGLDPRAWHRDGAQLAFRKQMCVVSSSQDSQIPGLFLLSSLSSHVTFSTTLSSRHLPTLLPHTFGAPHRHLRELYLKRAGTSYPYSQLCPHGT